MWAGILKNQGNNLFYLRKLPKSTSNLAKQSFEPSVFKAMESGIFMTRKGPKSGQSGSSRGGKEEGVPRAGGAA